MKILPTLLALCVLLPSARAEEKTLSALDFDAARAAARDAEKFLVVAFVQEGNAESKRLDSTWRDGKVREWIAAKAIAIAVDVGKQPALAEEWRVHHVPTIVFLGPSGIELDRSRGFRDAKAFLADAASVATGKDAIVRTKEKLATSERDPWLRLDHACALHDQGRLRDALEAYLACWDRGVEADPAFAYARTRTVLPRIVKLAEIYPAATDAAIARVQKIGEKATEGVATDAEIADFLELTDAFDRDDLVLALDDVLKPKGASAAPLRKKLAPRLADQLIDEKRYDEALAALGDAEKELDARIAAYEAQRKQAAERAGADPGLALERGRIVGFAVDCFEAALTTSQGDLASRLAARAVAFDPSVRTYADLIARARRTRSTPIAVTIVRQALASDLPPEDKQRLRDSTIAFPRLK